jgi:WD40 repeat protein
MLAVESTGGGYIYDTTSWELLASIPTESLEDNSLSNLTFFPDNQSLLFVAGLVSENVLYSVFWRYDLRTGTISRAFDDIEEQSPYETPFFSPDGKLLVFHSSFCTKTETGSVCRDALQLRDANTGDLIRRIPGNGLDKWEDMSVFAFRSDSNLIASGGEDGAVRVWDVASGMLKYKFQHESNVTSLSFSPDGSVLVSVGDDAAVRFWDVESGATEEQSSWRSPASPGPTRFCPISVREFDQYSGFHGGRLQFAPTFCSTNDLDLGCSANAGWLCAVSR